MFIAIFSSPEYLLPFPLFKNHEHFPCLFLVINGSQIHLINTREASMMQVEGAGVEDRQRNKIARCGQGRH